ncbi:MAG: hypothetical protein SCALA701_30150 [Candidatus Scalindua sp.]|nr:hypothetical protein [Planctomycetota bacterium]GJQ60214.1 MAG: hypothetical protein SCALA701_30150 [Candidatus Scalindua sp.]
MNKIKNSWIIGLLVIFFMGVAISGTAKAAEKTNRENDTLDAKQIIERVCTKCHNINRIVFSPDRNIREWVQIIAFANRKEHFITKEEMAAVIKWLQVHLHELKPASVDLEALTKGFDPATKEFLINNNCLICHTGEKIQQKAGLLSVEEWQDILSRMKLKGPALLNDTDTDKAAEYLANFHMQTPEEIAESVKGVIDRLETDK